MKKIFLAVAILLVVVMSLTACDETTLQTSGGTREDTKAQARVADELALNQKTPTDIDYSLERYNLIRRAYWVNGQREKANSLPCPVEKPLGYIVLFAGNATVGRFVVDGKVSSLNSFLTPSAVDSPYGSASGGYTTLTTETADVDGSYGQNDNGIFFFTSQGNYIEYTGQYLYSDIPFEIGDAVVTYKAG